MTHLQHLSCTDHRFSSHITLGYHHFLRHEDLTGRDFNPEISSSNHNTVRLLEDFVKVHYTLFVLDFDYDFDVRALVREHTTDMSDVVGTADEGCKDHVDVVFHTKSEILLVLLGKGGQIDRGFRKIDSFARGESPAVEGFNAELVTRYGQDLKRQDT